MNPADARASLAAGSPLLSVGLLTADLGHLADELARLEAAGVRMVHTDVMDGVFCPMLTVGSTFVGAQRTSLLKDVHLMIDEPLDKLAMFFKAGADMITFQVESARNPHRVLQVLGDAQNENDPSRGIIRGVAVSPGTPLEVLPPLLGELDYVMLLAINPGWGGQLFHPYTAARLEHARRLIAASGREILLGVDGGVTKHNIAEVAGLGTDIVVTGSAIFDGTQAVEANVAYMHSQLKEHAGPSAGRP
jgi:ribulose-phosphate 3-epimerase